MPTKSGDLYKVAYDEAVRALSGQRAAIDSLRARAGLLLSAAAVTTSFLGAEALNGSGLNGFSLAGLTAFVGVAVFSLAILWPRDWELAADPGRLIEDHVNACPPGPVVQLYRDLSIHMRDSYAENQGGIDFLASLFQMASTLLTLEVVLWIVAIASTA